MAPWQKLCPMLLIILDVAAAIGYAIFTNDWRRVVYWIAAAVLTASITF